MNRNTNLIVQVLSKGETLLLSSRIDFKFTDTTLNLVIDESSDQAPTEYEQLLRETEPLVECLHVSGIPNPTLTDKLINLSSDQMDFLSQQMHIDNERIPLLAISSKLQTEASQRGLKLPTEIFFAVGRSGLPTDLRELLSRRSKESMIL